MRTIQLFITGAAAAALVGCSTGGGLQVRTAVEPGANLSGLNTFFVLTPPARRADATALSTNDPMLENSITNRQLRDDLGQAFQSRGYTQSLRQSASFLVAYYAGTKQKFDTTYWGPTFDPAWRYSYRGRRNWAWPYDYPGVWNGGSGVNVTSYTQGQVIVDVIDPQTNQLIWRGQGLEPVSTDPVKYANALQGVVDNIVGRFPQGMTTAAISGSR